ncbi:MAG: S8 family serine peptidase [Verrucomicrobia bacterium]|nr:S8 family serine peptidase [Verrucomicrobiota bacterium]
MAAIILLASLTASAFAGLREDAPRGWQASTNGTNATPKVSRTSTSPANPGATIPRRLQPDVTNCVPGEILLKLRKTSKAALALDEAARAGKAVNFIASQTNEISALLQKHGVAAAKTVFNRARRAARDAGLKAQTGQDRQRDGLFQWYRLRVPTNAELKQVLADFKANPAVEYAEPAYEWRLHDVDPPITGLPDGTTDPQINQQWHHSFIQAQAAWNYLKQNGVPVGGKRDVVVAVIDTGVDYNHEELIGNIWTNPREIPGNNIDDDGNGFVDDIHGCSVVSDGRSHVGDPIDLHGHGTHVAGIIAATAFNLKGGVGVAFNVQIMGIRAAQYSGALSTTDIAEAILYAADNGADVINMSFGGYQRSQVVEDALAVALNQAVLVAAAGNDNLDARYYPVYPAALPFVHGIMAHDTIGTKTWFSNYDTTGTRYLLAAPGESIFSILPGNQYAAWSGTSMATPIVSGIAALMRSYWWQREVFSSRFLMGGLWNCGNPNVNAYKAVTELPAPGVGLLETWLFDNQAISASNDADGRADSGETLHLAIEVINRSGQASNVVATLRARAEGAVFDDPYVSLVTNTVSFGNIGPFNTADNGFIYNPGGVITGVEHPFVFHVATNCPNDHVIPFELTFTFLDGWDPTSTNTFTNVARFKVIVQRGKNLPSVIPTGMTLTLDQSDYWMVGGPVLVEAGATLRITEGAQVQWGAISSDPYNPGPQTGSLVVRGVLSIEGAASNPVSLFPSYLVSGQTTLITAESGGVCDLQYVTIRNPWLTGIRTINHGRLEWDALSSTIDIEHAANTAFGKFRGGGTMSIGRADTCLFDTGWLVPSGLVRSDDCVFLQDNENNKPLSVNLPLSFKNPMTCDSGDTPFWSSPLFTNGVTYVVLPMEQFSLRLAEAIASFYDGHVASVRDEAESDFLKAYLPGAANFRAGGILNHDWVYIGLSDRNLSDSFSWVDGSPLEFTDWASGYPVNLSSATEHVVQFMDVYNNGNTRLWGWRNVDQTPSIRFGNGSRGSWKSFVLKLPGTWTLDQLNLAPTNGTLLAYVRDHFEPQWQRNAFLSKYWDPSIANWMRVVSQAGVANGYTSLQNNYWGTDNPVLINHMIVDYYDNFTSARIDYGTPPSSGFASTYPFVEKVFINGIPAETVPQMSGGRGDFSVVFNRNMNTNTEPFVTFGPSPPHTDFSITPRDDNFHQITNGWLNARTWQGSAWITPVSGEGYHLMRISGAVAADDPWLVSGYDVGRFRFKVQTMGIASMTLQASGQEGAILLTWQQNDYELLAGYNLYRADSTNGPWTRLNSTVIPPGSESYSDSSVPPAVPKFYKFTVLTTDMTESEPSNLASAAALDTIPPVLTHTPVTSALPARGLQLRATATDNLRVTGVTVFYRPSASGANYTSLPMVNVTSNDWSATILGSSVQSPGVEYYLTATDGISEVFSGTPLLPHVVSVSNIPTLASVTPNHGPSTGGTAVTLSGTLFEPGVSVLFGGVLASNVTLISENQLACNTPPHFPALVDVTILNTNGTQSTLLSAFQFEQTGVIVSLPTTNGNYGTQVELGLSAANVAGLRAVDVTITFDPSVLSIIDARVGAFTAGWGLAANLNTPGRAVLSLANASSVTGSGSLVVLRFNIVKSPPASTVLTIESLSLNDGAITTTRSDGLFTVNGFFTLAGTVRYFGGSQEGVTDVSLHLNGAGAFQTNSASDGGYSITNIPTGSYVLTPAKTSDVAGITSYDASLVLQAAAGLLTLSSNQVLAADVNRNGSVSAMDASYILEKAVGLIEGAFPGAGRFWDFRPAQRSYSLLNSDQTGQDFTAILLGDVSGNWSNPAPSPMILQGSESSGPKGSPAEVILALRTLRTEFAETQVWLLVRGVDAAIYSVDLLLSHDPSRPLQGLQAGAFAEPLAMSSNTNQAGVVRVGLAGAEPLQGVGALLVFTLSDEAADPLNIVSASINEGAVPVVIDPDGTEFDGDTDGDGQSDWSEIRAGTTPTDTQSYFAIRSVTLESGGTRKVSWSAVPGKLYQVLYLEEGIGGEWQPLGLPVTATGQEASVQDDAAMSGIGRLYRVRLVE